MDNQEVDERQRRTSTEVSPCVADRDDTVIQVDDFKGFLNDFKKYVSPQRWLNCRIKHHKGSLLFSGNISGVELLSKGDWTVFENFRSKYKHNRKILVDGTFIVVKELPSLIHSRSSAMLQSILSRSLCKQLLMQDGKEDYEKLVPCGDGSKQSFCSFLRGLISELSLGRFTGEPDGGLAWFGEVVPFLVLETGYSDSGRKHETEPSIGSLEGEEKYILLFSAADL
jgi:hypothetical protein